MSEMESACRLHTTSTKYFIRYFHHLGIRLSDKPHSSLRSYVIVLAGIIQMISSISLSIQQWNYINIRVAAFTKFGEYSICTLSFGYLVFRPEHCVQLFSLTDTPLDKSQNNWNARQCYVRNGANDRAKTIQKLYLIAGITLWFFTNFIPCVLEICILLIKPLQDIQDNEMFFLYFFKPYLTQSTIIIYCVISLLQTSLYLIMISTTSLHYSVVTTAIKMLEAEVKVLCISINEMSTTLTTNRIETRHLKSIPYKIHTTLKGNLAHVINHHQQIILSVERLNNVASFLLIAFNGIITTQLSLELYCTLETDEPWMHFLRIPGSVICYGVLCFLGQGLINEGDNLKQSIDWFPWTDTPRWFKQSLFIMITCTRKPLEIKPSRLYVLNCKNWMSVIQAAYSYLNMMRSFKANRGV